MGSTYFETETIVGQNINALYPIYLRLICGIDETNIGYELHVCCYPLINSQLQRWNIVISYIMKAEHTWRHEDDPLFSVMEGKRFSENLFHT